MIAKDKIQIREASYKDSGLLLNLYNGLYPKPTDKIKSFRLPRAKSAAFIAEIGNEPAGFIILTYIAYGAPGVGFGYIEELFIRTRFRGYGLGKLLVTRALSWYEKKGYNVIFLTTPKTNLGAIKFYRHLGFRKNKQVWLQYAKKRKTAK